MWQLDGEITDMDKAEIVRPSITINCWEFEEAISVQTNDLQLRQASANID